VSAAWVVFGRSADVGFNFEETTDLTPYQLIKLAAAAVSALAIVPGAALAQPAEKSASQCFARSLIDGFNAPDDRTVYLRVGVRDVWRLDLMTDCINLTFRQSLGLESIPGSAWICSPLEATVVYGDTGIRQRCPVKAMHKLTPDELAAVPKRDRP
jgi:hypothetical protein